MRYGAVVAAMIEPPQSSVREARDRYLAENGFAVEDYRAAAFRITLFGRSWRLPNFHARKARVPLHDLHHVATGYGTSLVGEAELSAWELRAGLDHAFLWWFKLSAIAIGLVLAPRRVLGSFRRARGCRSLFGRDVAYESLLDESVGELRARLGIPEGGLAERPAERHAAAPSSRLPGDA